MYNYYTDLKIKKSLEAKQKEDDQSNRRKKKRQVQLPKLVESYENRIKGFLYQMAEKPIKIKEVQKGLHSTREDLYNEQSDKIIGTKGFVFSKYKTDKERAKEYSIKHKEDFLYEQFHDPKLVQNYQITQPTMRFKPRTDLERICDVLAAYNDENKAKEIIFNQLSNVGLNVSKPVNIPKTEEEEDDEYKAIEIRMEDIEKERQKSKGQKQRKANEINPIPYKPRTKPTIKRIDNSDAKKIYADLYNKTYFKATENYSLFKTSCLLNHDQFNQRKQLYDPYMTHFYKKARSRPQKEVTFEEYNKLSIGPSDDTGAKDLIGILNTCTNNYSSTKEKEMNLLKSLESVDLFTQTIKEKKEKKDMLDSHKLSIIKDLAFNPQQTINYNYNSNAPIKYHSKLKRKPTVNDSITQVPNNDIGGGIDDDIPNKIEEKIKIDGEEYNKNDYNRISKKILSNCGWTHHKNKQANDCLKARNGKLMCTNGLTVSEFEKKHRLQTIY